MNKIHILVLAAAVALSGCATNDAYTGEEKTASATKGSIIGAVSGAVIGAATSSKGDRGKGILIGAASGAVVGGGIGGYMDKQEAELRQELQNTGVSVVRQGDTIQLVMPNNLTFDVDSSQLKSTAINTLSGVVTVLEEFDETQVIVTGHTDSTGSPSYNLQLSQLRANAVAAALMQGAIDNTRMSTFGAGQTRPIASNDTSAGRAQNRRVEIYLTPQP